jgi:PHD/YefM family antitoxin component YafN of YafNO toxin-antitoxin module
MYTAAMADEFVTVAQLRAQMATILARLGKARGHVYLLQRGQPRAVLVDIKEYEALIDRLEFLDDSVEAMLAHERLKSGEETTRPFDDVMREIRARRAGRTRKPKPLRRRARVSP